MPPYSGWKAYLQKYIVLHSFDLCQPMLLFQVNLKWDACCFSACIKIIFEFYWFVFYWKTSRWERLFVVTENAVFQIFRTLFQLVLFLDLCIAQV